MSVFCRELLIFIPSSGQSLTNRKILVDIFLYILSCCGKIEYKKINYITFSYNVCSFPILSSFSLIYLERTDCNWESSCTRGILSISVLRFTLFSSFTPNIYNKNHLFIFLYRLLIIQHTDM